MAVMRCMLVRILAVLVVASWFEVVDGSECESSYAYMDSSTSSDRGKMLSGHLVRNVTGVRSIGECLAICLRQGANCQSFNFASSLRVCHVNDGTKSDHPNDFVSDSDFNYYGPSSSHWLKRQDGSQEFYLGWSDYVNGFGTVSGEYWLGLERLYRLASSTVVLRVDLQDWNYNWYYAQYYFYSHASNDYYRGYFWSYSGTAGDSLSGHNGYQFSTYDADHDGWGGNCAYSYHGAWWYTSCHSSNLNGYYINGGTTSGYANAAVWYHLHGHNYGLMRTEMKIRG
ncbi:microfibril-associated glycoprotein 4-like [Diadema antillarum]|uniref:microfibril-associated glycoprotein 4-like n=1 Tax=Diadema antillarum TaxID=105358 RepID=UPI003A88F7A6